MLLYDLAPWLHSSPVLSDATVLVLKSFLLSAPRHLHLATVSRLGGSIATETAASTPVLLSGLRSSVLRPTISNRHDHVPAVRLHQDCFDVRLISLRE